MKVLVVGGKGQLGREIEVRAAKKQLEYVSVDLPEVDIRKAYGLQQVLKQQKPSVVINCAAYTQVDRAEEECEAAFAVNRDGAANVARAAADARAKLIHLSTDYVFDGKQRSPLVENTATKPISVYGESKLAGEEEISSVLGGEALIVRTSALHGQYGPNFVHTMIELFQKRKELKIVDDQVTSPTWAGWLADVLLDLCSYPHGGVIHASCAGEVSWYGFACEILEYVRDRLDEPSAVSLQPCTTADYPTPAKRPAYSVFDTSKLTGIVGHAPLSWRDGLKGHLRDLGHLA